MEFVDVIPLISDLRTFPQLLRVPINYFLTRIQTSEQFFRFAGWYLSDKALAFDIANISELIKTANKLGVDLEKIVSMIIAGRGIEVFFTDLLLIREIEKYNPQFSLRLVSGVFIPIMPLKESSCWDYEESIKLLLNLLPHLDNDDMAFVLSLVAVMDPCISIWKDMEEREEKKYYTLPIIIDMIKDKYNTLLLRLFASDYMRYYAIYNRDDVPIMAILFQKVARDPNIVSQERLLRKLLDFLYIYSPEELPHAVIALTSNDAITNELRSVLTSYDDELTNPNQHCGYVLKYLSEKLYSNDEEVDLKWTISVVKRILMSIMSLLSYTYYPHEIDPNDLTELNTLINILKEYFRRISDKINLCELLLEENIDIYKAYDIINLLSFLKDKGRIIDDDCYIDCVENIVSKLFTKKIPDWKFELFGIYNHTLTTTTKLKKEYYLGLLDKLLNIIREIPISAYEINGVFSLISKGVKEWRAFPKNLHSKENIYILDCEKINLKDMEQTLGELIVHATNKDVVVNLLEKLIFVPNICEAKFLENQFQYIRIARILKLVSPNQLEIIEHIRTFRQFVDNLKNSEKELPIDLLSKTHNAVRFLNEYLSTVIWDVVYCKFDSSLMFVKSLLDRIKRSSDLNKQNLLIKILREILLKY